MSSEFMKKYPKSRECKFCGRCCSNKGIKQHEKGHRKDSCEAGIRFDSLPGHGKPGFMDACPCFGPSSGCDRAEYPTPEEIAQKEAELNKRLIAIGNARKAIVESLGGPWKRVMSGSTGVIDCPACGSKDSLQFSRSGYNGHIHAHCKTDGCVSWME